MDSEIRMLDPSKTEVSVDRFGRLVVCIAGTERYENVRARRAFPLSGPATHVVLSDNEQHEIGVVVDTGELDQNSRSALGCELELVYFTTKVQAIESVRSRHGSTSWKFRTNRGGATAHVKDRSDIRALPGGRIIFTDIHGLKFEIPNIAELDDRSQALLDAES